MKYKIKGEIDNLDIVKQICETRGVDYSNLELFLNPKEWVKSSPSIYNNLIQAAETIVDSLKNNFNIGICHIQNIGRGFHKNQHAPGGGNRQSRYHYRNQKSQHQGQGYIVF